MPTDTTHRTPSEARARRAWTPLARLPVFFALDGKRAVLAGGSAGGGLEGGTAVGRRRAGRVYRRRHVRRDAARSPTTPPRGTIALHRRAWSARRFRPAPPIAVGAFEDDADAAALCRGRARGRRAGQRDRQAGVLRFLLRRDRQPLAAGDRHLDRRRRAGLRAGDPRQARGAAAARLRRLGGGGAALARAREGVRAFVRRPAQVLAAVHRACGGQSRPARRREADFDRFARRGAKATAARSRTARSRWSAPAPAIRNC